jgi:predicted S18 family serine protease
VISLGYTGRSMLRRFGPLALLTCLTVGCSTPPTKEHEQAEDALKAARAADASTYAADELQAAQAALDKYDQAVQQRDYREALSDAIDARDRAFEAARQASAQRATARTQLLAAVAEVDAMLKSAQTRLAGGPGPRLGVAAADRLRSAVRAATTALQEARTRFDQQQYRDGLARLQPIAEELRRAAAPPESGRRGRGAR